MSVDDDVVQADFGIATLADLYTPSRTRTGGAGSDRYTAPEVLAGAMATPASDVYSLAVTLTELAGTTTADLLTVDEPDRTQTGGPPLLAVGAQPVRHLLASMLASQPADRPSAAAVATRLQDASRRLAGSAESPGNSSSAAGAGHPLPVTLTEGSRGQLKPGRPHQTPLRRPRRGSAQGKSAMSPGGPARHATDLRRQDRGRRPDARRVTVPGVVPSQPRRPGPRT